MLGRRSSSIPKAGATALEVVIAGGGVAALETALALHELAGDQVKLTLLSPTADFVYRPVAVLERCIQLSRDFRQRQLARRHATERLEHRHRPIDEVGGWR